MKGSQAFADRVKQVRRSRRWTQRRLSVQMNVRVATVCAWEHGAVPDLKTLIRIGKLFGVSAAWLVGEVVNPGQRETLTPDEQLWLQIYRQMRPERRPGAIEAAREGEALWRSLETPTRS